MDKLRMAHASTHGARKPPGTKNFCIKRGTLKKGKKSKLWWLTENKRVKSNRRIMKEVRKKERKKEIKPEREEPQPYTKIILILKT